MINGELGYSIEKKDNKKKVIITFDGFTKPDMVEKFLKDYEKLKKSVSVQDTCLVLNGKTLKVFPQELEENLAQLYTDYTQFKKIYIVKPDQIVTKMQIERILKAANIKEKFEFINSVDDVK